MAMDLDAVRQSLHQRGLRLTRERDALLAAFMSSERLFMPSELHAFLRGEGQGVGLATVYRLLELLTEMGLATPFLIGGAVNYAFCGQGHHHHFVCLDCKGVKDIESCPEVSDFPAVGKVDYHRFDLYGHCEGCLEARPPC